MRYTTGHDRTGHRYVHNSIKVLTITSYFHHIFCIYYNCSKKSNNKILFHNFFLRTAPRQYAVLLNCCKIRSGRALNAVPIFLLSTYFFCFFHRHVNILTEIFFPNFLYESCFLHHFPRLLRHMREQQRHMMLLAHFIYLLKLTKR